MTPPRARTRHSQSDESSPLLLRRILSKQTESRTYWGGTRRITGIRTMPRRHWAGSASASVLVLFLGAASAFGQPAATIDSTLGVPLPEQPELRILKGDAPIEHLDVPALPEVTVKVEPEH